MWGSCFRPASLPPGLPGLGGPTAPAPNASAGAVLPRFAPLWVLAPSNTSANTSATAGGGSGQSTQGGGSPVVVSAGLVVVPEVEVATLTYLAALREAHTLPPTRPQTAPAPVPAPAPAPPPPYSSIAAFTAFTTPSDEAWAQAVWGASALRGSAGAVEAAVLGGRGGGSEGAVLKVDMLASTTELWVDEWSDTGSGVRYQGVVLGSYGKINAAGQVTWPIWLLQFVAWPHSPTGAFVFEVGFATACAEPGGGGRGQAQYAMHLAHPQPGSGGQQWTEEPCE